MVSDRKQKEKWLSYELAQRIVRNLRITSKRQYSKHYKKVKGLPSLYFLPNVYSDKWVSWSHFVEREEQKWLSYQEARQAAIRLGITTRKNYKERYKDVVGLPSCPDKVYADEWISWKDFLSQIKNWLNYSDAQQQVSSLGISSKAEYLIRYREVAGLPSDPSKAYPECWPGWKLFLGKPQRKWLSYQDAKSTVWSLGVKTVAEYNARYKDVVGLPCAPYKLYADEWISWKDFLGKNWLSYSDAQQQASSLGISSKKEYESRYREVAGLPYDPHRVYSECWPGWELFLGKPKSKRSSYQEKSTMRSLGIKKVVGYGVRHKDVVRPPLNKPQRKWLSYQDAKSTIRSLGIKTVAEYGVRYKDVVGLPSNPYQSYEDDWISWKDYLSKSWLSYSEAQQQVSSLGISSRTEYQSRYREVAGLPSEPERVYSECWLGWDQFLRLPKTKWLSYQKAKSTMRSLGIKTAAEYRVRYKEVYGLPAHPEIVYPEYWTTWQVFLDHDGSFRLDYQAAKDTVAALGIRGVKDYRRRYKEVYGLPFNPDRVYTSEWQGWRTFLNRT